MRSPAARSPRIWWAVVVAGICSCAVFVTVLSVSPPARSAPAQPTGSLELVGTSPLLSRGMNAALAVQGRYAYVGNRADGTHPDSGILVVDVDDPTRPKVVHQIGAPGAAQPGESTRELRVWPDQDLLVVLNFECHEVAHLCLGSETNEVEPTVRFFDIRGERAARPVLVATYELPANPHEFFLWDDPVRDGRALLYITTAYSGTGAALDRTKPHLLVTDITRAREDVFTQLLHWSPERDPRWDAAGLHSLSVSHDGGTAYLADLEGGFLMADTSDLAAGRPDPAIRQLTPGGAAVHHEEPGAHSAVPLPGRPFALISDEVYGQGLGAGQYINFNMMRGCPWGWTRLIDTHDPARPRVVGEYKVAPWNTAEGCEDVSLSEDQATSFSSHNPTVTANLGLITWHSAGLRAVDLGDPAHPRETAAFLPPEPLDRVQREDPALTGGGAVDTIMWSYPVVQDGLIYVVDIRNGLFILRYRGPFATELRCQTRLEGNSNLGDPVRGCGVAVRQRQRCSRGRVKVRVVGHRAADVRRYRTRRTGRTMTTTVTLIDGTTLTLAQRAKRCDA